MCPYLDCKHTRVPCLCLENTKQTVWCVAVSLCREPTLTTRTNSFSGCLDYIWLSKRHWQVQSTLQLPFQEPSGEPGPPDRVKLDTCPNQHQPSDHLLIGCDVVLMPSAGAAAEATPSAAAAAAADKVSKMVAS